MQTPMPAPKPGALDAVTDPTIAVRFESTWAGRADGFRNFAEAVEKLDTQIGAVGHGLCLSNYPAYQELFRTFNAAVKRYTQIATPDPRFVPVGTLDLNQVDSHDATYQLHVLCSEIGIREDVRLAAVRDDKLLFTVHACQKWGPNYLAVIRHSMVDTVPLCVSIYRVVPR